LRLDDLADTGTAPAPTSGAGGESQRLADIERDHILRVLDACEWRVRGAGNAAQQLDLNANTLYSRMKKLGIRRSASRSRHSTAESIA
jgi:transcriptional regulator of acetoin/glycerol metabolism